jgi:hypothetical protein
MSQQVTVLQINTIKDEHDVKQDDIKKIACVRGSVHCLSGHDSIFCWSYPLVLAKSISYDTIVIPDSLPFGILAFGIIIHLGSD